MWETPERLVARRSFLAGGFGAAAVVGVGGPSLIPFTQPRSNHAIFAHGVASGDPLPDAVVLWTRVTPVPMATPGSGRGQRIVVEWHVAKDPNLREVVASGQIVTGPEHDHTVKVDATGLRADTRYWYGFTFDGHWSPVGATRTVPRADAQVERLRWGVVSCANWQAGYFSAYRHLAERDDLDLIVHLGDYLYEYQPGKYAFGHNNITVRPHDPPRETITLGDYRRRHAQYKTDPDLQALHAKLPFVVTWDDHEVADGYWTDGAFEHQGYEGSFEERRTAAQRAYDEWMPVRLGGTATVGDGSRMYRDFQFGDLAHLSMLDLRNFRADRLPYGDAGRNPKRTMTGFDQRAWLLERLESTSARWKLIGNPVLMAPVHIPRRPEREIFALGELTDLGPSKYSVNPDGWSAFPGDQRTVLGFIREKTLDDVVFLTGDVHTSWANDLVTSRGEPLATEFVVPAITSNNVDDFMGSAPRTASLTLEQAIQDVNPSVRWLNLDDHGFAIFDVTAERAKMEWWAISDRTDPEASAQRMASWQVRSGQAGLQVAD